MATIPKFDPAVLEGIARAIGDTSDGLTGPEIGRVLAECRIADPGEGTKWKRIAEALHTRQQADGCGNNIVAFIHVAMRPVRFVRRQPQFDLIRGELNLALRFAGLALDDTGRLRHEAPVNTLNEATERAGKLKRVLRERQVHPLVLDSCRAELVADNYFHAVFEATKSVAVRLRVLANSDLDGSQLVDYALGISQEHPRVAFNSMQTRSEKDEHKGMANLLRGIFSMFRNPIAHEPKLFWNVSEQDALDMLATLSLIHRKLDGAVATNIVR